MKAPVLIATVLTVATIGAAPASAASNGPREIGGGCPPAWCGDGNHNEILTASEQD